MVAVPDHFPHKGIHEQFANLDVVGILKDFGEQEFLYFLDRKVSIRFLFRLIDLDLQFVELCL